MYVDFFEGRLIEVRFFSYLLAWNKRQKIDESAKVLRLSNWFYWITTCWNRSKKWKFRFWNILGVRSLTNPLENFSENFPEHHVISFVELNWLSNYWQKSMKVVKNLILGKFGGGYSHPAAFEWLWEQCSVNKIISFVVVKRSSYYMPKSITVVKI